MLQHQPPNPYNAQPVSLDIQQAHHRRSPTELYHFASENAYSLAINCLIDIPSGNPQDHPPSYTDLKHAGTEMLTHSICLKQISAWDIAWACVPDSITNQKRDECPYCKQPIKFVSFTHNGHTKNWAIKAKYNAFSTDPNHRKTGKAWGRMDLCLTPSEPMANRRGSLPLSTATIFIFLYPGKYVYPPDRTGICQVCQTPWNQHNPHPTCPVPYFPSCYWIDHFRGEKMERHG